MFGKTLINEVANRRAQTKKLLLAQKEYDEMIEKANQEKNALIAEAVKHRDSLIAEGVLIAKKEKEAILTNAQKEALLLIERGEKKAENISSELEKNWMQSVKQTAGVLVKSIFKKDVSLKEEYVKIIIEEMQKK